MATSQLKRTVVTPPGTQYSGVKKLETVSVAELNAYFLRYGMELLVAMRDVYVVFVAFGATMTKLTNFWAA
ncbi:unnamed protein product [Brassica rapa]|uniref:Uncharacterized protein n=2 Tax=Brassica TaxID=3705 RepID=A0A3P6AM92_BRACM|nr:unnamed protein product [Brassica napus]CAG7894821.1 unnamed protein product [Brassica rapa]CDY37146.1 BnaA02g24650D [Brassica napus]VDC90885.1 unnamed protein product [Brassica rapa]